MPEDPEMVEFIKSLIRAAPRTFTYPILHDHPRYGATLRTGVSEEQEYILRAWVEALGVQYEVRLGEIWFSGSSSRRGRR